MVVIYDGENKVLGRLGTLVAKDLLKGEEVVVLNAEKIKISGYRNDIVEKYQIRRRLKSKQNPEHSPKWPKVPNMLVRRIFRGMLPYKTPRGRDAYKRLRVSMGVPVQFVGKECKDSKRAENNRLTKFTTMLKVCQGLGYNVR